MTVKEYLSQSNILEKRIEANLAEIERLKSLRFNLASSNLNIDYVQSSKSNNAPFEKCIEKIIDLQDDLQEAVIKLMDIKREILGVISNLEDNNELLVLQYRYLQNKTWEEIGKILHADRTTVYRWHNCSLKKLKIKEMYNKVKYDNI